MTTATHRRSIRPTVARAVASGLLCTVAAAQQVESPQAIWDDPVFQRQFIASYGVNADVEPRVTPDEVEVLEKVRPLMSADLAKAEQTLRKRIKPDSSAILDFTLGGILFQQERMDEALAAYEVALAKFPSFRRAWRNVGLIRVRNGEYDPAIAAFTKMIELGGADAYVYGLLAFAYSAKQDFQPAEAAYRNAMLLQPENTEWRLGLTRCVFKQQKYEDAASLLDVLIERFPDKADFWLLQAHTYMGMKRPLDAATNLEALDRLHLATVDSQHTLGDIYLSEGLPDLATAAYVRAIELDPEQPVARAIRAAEVLAVRGAPKEARKVIQLVRRAWEGRLDESDRRKVLKLEARLAMADGEGGDETAALLEEIVALDPLDGDALILLGQHHARRNDPDRAMLYYERAGGIEAFEVVAKIRHAQTLVGLGRYGDAIPLLRRAQEVRPREDIARYLEQVERISRARR